MWNLIRSFELIFPALACRQAQCEIDRGDRRLVLFEEHDLVLRLFAGENRVFHIVGAGTRKFRHLDLRYLLPLPDLHQLIFIPY